MPDSGNGGSVLLKNARLVLPHKVIDNGTLLIKDLRIARVIDSAADKATKADSIIDLSGLTLFPGFIDIHIHGAMGVDTMAADASALSRVAEFLARHGVTAWLPTLVPSATEQYSSAINAIEKLLTEQQPNLTPEGVSGLPAGQARVLGVHYEGPFVNSEKCGALHREHFRTFANISDVDALPTIKGPGAIHLMTLAPEIEGGIPLVKHLKRRGWIVSIGHTQATSNLLDQASAAGASHMTHFMNAMSPLNQRAPGPVGWGLLRDDISIDVIADGIHLDPLVLKILLRCKTPARMSLISDAIAATGLGDGDHQIWGETISVKNGRTQNRHGSIAGSVITMLDAVRMMRSIGSSDAEIGGMASLNPAHLLGIDRDCGSIESGKRADLVALDNDGRVRLTLINGEVAFDSLNKPK